jgi:hypothetical protein
VGVLEQHVKRKVLSQGFNLPIICVKKTSCDPTATPANGKPGLLEDERNIAAK